jgi:hypothetical protein
VMTWIEQFAKDHAQKPEPLGRVGNFVCGP